jgi:hypothetical protein
MKPKHLLPLTVALLMAAVSGCSTVKKLAANGIGFVASIGTNSINLLDVGTPLVQDPAQPGDTNAVVINPALVTAAQGAATTFGGPYGVPIAASLGVVAGIAGMFITQSRRRKAGTAK